MANKKKQRQGLKNPYTRTIKPVRYGRERFQFSVRQGGEWKSIDDFVTAASWVDESALASGSVSLTRPDAYQGEVAPIGLGSPVLCRVDRYGTGRYVGLWQMRVTERSGGADGTRELTLQSDMALIQKSKDDFKYVKGKRHPHGWLCHEIVTHACRRDHVRVEKLAKGKHQIVSLVRKNTSLYELIRDAYAKEATDSGQRYFVNFRRGVVVEPIRYPRSLLALSDTIIDATINQTQREDFATVARVHATAGKGKKSKKIDITVRNQRGIGKYGFVRKKVSLGSVKDEAEARRKGIRALAKTYEPKREATFTHPGLPFTRRGDAIKLSVPSEGFHELVYISAVSHTIDDSGYTMEVTCRFSDPYKSAVEARAKKRKCDAARRRKRKTPKGCPGKAKPKAKKKAQRG